MRKLFVVAAVLVGLGLALFLLNRPGGEAGSPAAGSGQASAAGQPSAPAKRAGTVLQPESPEDVGARGTADPGSTPTLAQAPAEEDGVLEVEVLAGERPVPGASVRLYWRGSRDPNLNEISWRLASTGATDAQGKARLASRPGGYLVTVRAEGYGRLVRDVVRPYGEARTVVRLALEAGQGLTGRTVEQGTQEPVPLVELVLTAHGRQLEFFQRAEAPAEERAYGSSDERGSFRIDGLAPGKYMLEARAPGHGRTVMRSVRVPAAGPLTVALKGASTMEGFVLDAQGNPAAGAEVQLGGSVPEVATTGSGGGFSVEVEPGSYTVSARRGTEAGSLGKPVAVSAGKTVRDVRIQLGQGSALEGRVVAKSTGAPIAGASVDVSPFGGNGDSGRGVTDGSGQFSVGGLAPGSYDLVVSAPGYSTLTRRGLTVSAGERFPVEIQLVGTGAVEGRVLDSAGQPIAGAQVVGGDRWGGSLSGAPAEARTGAEGRYRVEGLSVGAQVLAARREGTTLGATQRVSVTEGATAQADFTLAEAGTVEGVIRAASGALPAEQLAVLAFPQRTMRFMNMDFRPAEADASGAFRMTLPPGSYEMHAMLGERRNFGSQEPKVVEVEAGKTVRTELILPEDRAGEGLQGVVLEPDGTPSARAFVMVSGEGSGPGARRPRWMSPTDEQGRFSAPFSAQELASLSSLRVSATNGGRTGDVQGVKPGERDVVVKLRPSASARGRVVRANGGAPVKGFTLTLQSQDRGTFMMGDRTWEFAGDRFELGDVPASPLRVVIRTADGAGGEAAISPTVGTVTEVEVAVKGLAGVRGRVVDATTKEPLSEVLAMLEGERPKELDPRTLADGRFSLEGVAAGEHTLVLMGGPSRGMERRTVTLVEGQVLDLGDIELSQPRISPGTIGVIVNPQGEQITISQVTPDGPGARAGLQVGDVLLKMDGAPVASGPGVFQQLRGAPGSTVALTVRRAGAERTISVTRAP